MSSINPVTTQTTATTPATGAAKDQLDKDAFLKLLVAQLKYQDPMNPADPTAFMAQTAQFTQIEKLDQMQTQNDSMISANQATMAASMIGRTVSSTVDSALMTGKVTKVDFDPTNGPILFLDSNPTTGIPLSAVQEVQ